LLEQTRPDLSSTQPEADLSQALGHRAKIATEVAERLTFITVALHIKRTAAAARRRQQPIIIAIVIIAFSLAAFVGYEAWQVKQREWNIQATATALVVQATEHAIPIQATATALVTQAQIKMPPEFQELFERFGAILAYVPPGEFAMGSPEGEGNSDQHPQHTITLDGFWIGLTEVTNAQYQLFIDANGYQKQELWTKAGWAWRKSNAITQPGCWSDTNLTQPNFPVVCISWYEALAYTRWLAQEAKLNIRLPTEAEWEKTARGTDGRLYPWGDQKPTSDLVNIRSSIRQPEAAASYAKGASFYGALDIAGNVWEWTSTIYQPYPYNSEDGREVIDANGLRVLRGGSNRRSAYRSFKLKPDTRSEDIGFRIILSDAGSTILKNSDP
jgi:formylglycine-generating enzyme required for sulfatase activity